ncbi:MAG: hypothetical protein QOH24_915 [Verrucomicrobiota bacterium]
MVDGSGLENRQSASSRGFESHPLRQSNPYTALQLGVADLNARRRGRIERRSTGGARYAQGCRGSRAGCKFGVSQATRLPLQRSLGHDGRRPPLQSFCHSERSRGISDCFNGERFQWSPDESPTLGVGVGNLSSQIPVLMPTAKQNRN